MGSHPLLHHRYLLGALIVIAAAGSAAGGEFMHTVTSKDGTKIAYTLAGSGPPLVLVHGGTADHTRWAPVLPELQKHFTVYLVDRRGRGGSGDAHDYSIEREFDDVAAVVDSIGEPVYLLGHSYGALVSLEAALRTRHLAGLILYEPPIPTGRPIFPEGEVERLEALLAKGDQDGVVSTFFREVVRMPPTELTMLKQSPNWSARVGAAHTIAREMRAVDGYRLQPARFAGLKVRTRLFLGGDSPPFLRDAISALKMALPAADVVVLPGQQHVAMDTAPGLFVREVLAFLVP
jgi:pimeloyl-ACP methyl ester carboxylesterase